MASETQNTEELKATREQILRKLQNNTGGEMGHWDADKALCEMLRALGYDDIVDAFEAIPDMWYA